MLPKGVERVVVGSTFVLLYIYTLLGPHCGIQEIVPEPGKYAAE